MGGEGRDVTPAFTKYSSEAPLLLLGREFLRDFSDDEDVSVASVSLFGTGEAREDGFGELDDRLTFSNQVKGSAGGSSKGLLVLESSDSRAMTDGRIPILLFSGDPFCFGSFLLLGLDGRVGFDSMSSAAASFASTSSPSRLFSESIDAAMSSFFGLFLLGGRGGGDGALSADESFSLISVACVSDTFDFLLFSAEGGGGGGGGGGDSF